MAELLKAAPIREKHLELLAKDAQSLKAKGVVPSMKVILVGNLPASVIYTRNKKKFIEKFGGDCEIIKLSETVSESDFLAAVKKVVENPKVHGCFVQLPLPSHLQHIDVGALIPQEKDVDGFSSGNLNLLMHGDSGQKALLPCTPKRVITLCNYYDIDLNGKDVVVIGRSMIVGKPMALLLVSHNATVTICHSKTKDLKIHTKKADIIISAIGKPKFLNKEYIGKNKPIIIDIGINHDSQGKLCGDVDFDDVVDMSSAITPVPGGIGPMTILSLAQNLIQAANMQQ